ncbi:CIS tube protein [Microcoleus sp.]|uniref:CIS tube protein n=1 Tax=Microcoleus sp. TaxID=44472 RepID=UPI00403EED1F
MTFPGSPKLPKGAIVAVDSSTYIVVSTVAFQYNPETLTRTLQPQVASEKNGAKVEALRLEGAPVETIKFDVELDATDQLEQAEKNTIELGIYPQLSALETLIYPKSTQVISNMQQSKNGTTEMVPLEAPMTLLVWGNKRVLPVRITDFSITEEAYDVNLNPIRAKVTLSLRVLNYNDLPWGKPAAQLFLAHHKSKERMALLDFW